MSLSGPIFGTTLLRYFTAVGFTGAQLPQFSSALGNGIVNNILATNVYNGVTVGIGPGPGIGTGKVVGLVGPIVAQNIFISLSARGFTGSQLLNMCLGIGNAFSEHILTFGIINSTGTPVAIGTGSGSLFGIVGTLLSTSIYTTLVSVGLAGTYSSTLASGIGDGLALSMSTALVTTTIVGTPAPPPAGPIPLGGVESGKLF